ncbi:MAG: NRDE family protein [Desulfobacterales bacterium]|nr:NRDE family protein [Desulfobacterales bacterium]
MCLILFGVETSPDLPLILAANRDEFYVRPTRAMEFWADAPHILAGRDLEAGGTWMGVSNAGRFAALTNYRDLRDVKSRAPSRGELVLNILNHPASVQEAMHDIGKTASAYNGFNLLAGDAGGVFWYSNRQGDIQQVPPGWHGLSNHLLDTPWPKVERGKAEFQSVVKASPMDDNALFKVLTDKAQPPEKALPDTGVGLEWERILSPLFIQSPTYGTRCSTLMRITGTNDILVTERTYDTSDHRKYTDKRFSFGIRNKRSETEDTQE